MLLCISAKSQNLIARHSEGSVFFYTTPSAAVSSAINGDTIYIPAGSYPGFSVNVSIVVFGVGYDVDSTSVTGKTYISSIVNVYASNCRFEGLQLNSGVNIQGSVSNTTLTRCFIGSTLSLSAGSTGATVYNNILYVTQGNGSQNNLFCNNLVFTYITNIDYSIIKNNTFLYEGLEPISGFEFNEISNNIFLNDSYSAGGSNNSLFYHNLFCNLPIGDLPCDGFPYNNTNLCIDNLSGADEFSLFNDYTEGLLQANYFQNDLQASAGSVIINAGTDGTDLGIYGGTFPWKDGGLPQNPHIFLIGIPSVSYDNGMLDVEIKVNAQE